jgi:hypothetical protein
MPTRRKPQTTHGSVKFEKLFNRFHEELYADGRLILDRLGFYREFGAPGVGTYTGSGESIELLRELAGVLTRTATIYVDAGFKAPRQVIATLEAIVENPKLFFLETTEPEARGVVAVAYQRADESPGTFWTDLEICDEGKRVHP